MSSESLPSAVQDVLQQNMLDRKFQDTLKAKNTYRKTAYRLPMATRSGEQMIYSRNGHISPIFDNIVPSTNVGLDNGLTVNGINGTGDISFEQWSVFIGMLPKFLDINLMNEQEVIADLYAKYIEELSIHAAFVLDLRVARVAFQAYLSGSTYFPAAATAQTTIRVDNILGLNTAFQTITVNGNAAAYGLPQPVSNTYPLTATITNSSTGAVQTVTIVGATPDATSGLAQDPANISTLGMYGMSGTLTFSAAVTVNAHDTITAFDAPAIYRPNGKASINALALTDTLSAQMVLDAVAELRANGVPSPLSDGTYPCYLDPRIEAQIFTDPQYQVMSQGQMESQDFVGARVSRNFGVTFVTSTNAPAFTFTNFNNQQITARHAIVTGEKYVQESPFAGVEKAIKGLPDGGVVDTRLIDDFVFAHRLPIDRAGQIMSLGWYWIGGHVAPTDATITKATIPSASNARYKRAVVMQVANGN